jgi:citrate lyase subunit beta/citryl-CoA lyase
MGAMRIRSVLFAPGNRADVLAKLPRSAPDVAALDLEDAVPDAAKAEARAVVREAVRALASSAPSMALTVRVNAPASGHFAEDVAGLPQGLAAVIVPKLERAADVEEVRSALARADLDVGVIAGIETALGLEHAVEVLGAPGVVGGYFGAEDFVVDMGGVRTTSNVEVAYARARIAVAGRQAGVPVVDQVVADFGDAERFAAEAAEARAMGFAGKLCIHPSQVAAANAAFSPSDAEIERATALLAAYDAAVAAGRASIAFEGQMVDEPVARQARALLARR